MTETDTLTACKLVIVAADGVTVTVEVAVPIGVATVTEAD
jgi:hypothetical protein